MRTLFKPQWILPFFVATLIVGIIGGWIRLGWDLDFPMAAGYHGLLMVGGFMGGLITLERTITMSNRAWLIFPLCCIGATGFFLSDLPYAGAFLLVFASLGLVAFYLVRMTKHRDSYWYLLLGGALCWVIGNIRFLQTAFVPEAVHWWVGFILFTILGERLELTRFLPVGKRAKTVLWILMVGLGLGFFFPIHGYGKVIYTTTLILVVIWFLRYDMARHAIRKAGYHRYTGMGMITAYGWLLVHVLVILFSMNEVGGYDLYIHTFFLGFGFSMIWAHAPIILPAILKVNIRPFHGVLWVFWGVFQLTLLLRVIVSVTGLNHLRKLFGMMNGISILLMFVAMALTMIILLLKTRMPHRKLTVT